MSFSFTFDAHHYDSKRSVRFELTMPYSKEYGPFFRIFHVLLESEPSVCYI